MLDQASRLLQQAAGYTAEKPAEKPAKTEEHEDSFEGIPLHIIKNREWLQHEDGQTESNDQQKRQHFATGAQRDAGVPGYHLLPLIGLQRATRRSDMGAVKYSARNWEQGIPMPLMIDHVIDHIVKYLSGWVDEDHLGAAAWGLLAACDIEERHPELLRGMLWVRENEDGTITDMRPHWSIAHTPRYPFSPEEAGPEARFVEDHPEYAEQYEREHGAE